MGCKKNIAGEEMKKNIFLTIMFFCFIALISACETLPPPTPEQIINNPLGTSSLKLGMAKEAVIAIWGQPNEVIEKGSDELGSMIEEWIYYAKYPAVPVDYNYLSKTQVLTFSGNSLTKCE